MNDRITTGAAGTMVFEGSGIEVFRLLVIARKRSNCMRRPGSRPTQPILQPLC
jgi:hypothetical protein